MRPLEQLTITQRVVLLLATLALVIVALLLYERFTNGRVHAQPLPPSKYDQRIVELDRQAIEQAYVGQVELLFATWMRSPEGQPERALAGTNNARRAFIAAMDEIEKREKVK